MCPGDLHERLSDQGGEMPEASYPTYPARLLILGLILFGVAAGSVPCQEDSASLAKRGEKAGSNPSPNAPSDPVNTTNPKYIIGPGDLLDINVLHEPDVSQKVSVRMDGKITVPLIGEIQASGMMPDNLQATIAQKLHEYIKDAEVTVVVEEMKSRQFSVMGEVEHPGSFPLTKPTTVLDALAQAGGFRDFAKVSKIHVLRRNPSGTIVSLPFNYKQVSKGKNESQNLELQAGDTIIVP